ncbi:uncharacterized protein LOC120633490 [Pararge aegeria]|uniref:uncharacterized protein LOC120633490 n=1 Tax=Pararge aegeria TaxID=116150 RepID=UPI0019CFDC08|nr:uncharacterized protein LOC120633490 [Pararge aegeria]
MSNQDHERRSRSRYRASLSGHGTERSGDSDSGRRRRISHSRLTSKRHNSPNKVLIEQMQQLQNRLIALEGQRRSSPPRLHEPNADCLPALSPPRLRPVTATVAEQQRSVVEGRESAMQSSPGRPVSAMTDRDASGTDRIIEAIRSINTTVHEKVYKRAVAYFSKRTQGAEPSRHKRLSSPTLACAGIYHTTYRVVKALPHGRVELQMLAGSCGKATRAAAEFMVPWRGEWTPDTCAAFFEGELVCYLCVQANVVPLLHCDEYRIVR